jgi:CheY-like chemotaxis protein
MEEAQQVRVLIADDNPAIRMVIADILEGEDDLLLVGEAGDALEAAQVGKTVAADVAILDVNMPEGGGWEAARLLRIDNPDIRLIAYSAYEKGMVTHTMKAAGINAYVTKGSDPQLLLDAVRGDDISVSTAPKAKGGLRDKLAEKGRSA